MRLKRYVALAASIVLFIFVFIGYFAYTRAAMENRFRDERIKYGVDGTVLTATPPSPDKSTPATPPASPDTNAIIGPVPPQTASSDNSAAAANPTPSPAPAPVDPNAAPVSSTPPAPSDSSTTPGGTPTSAPAATDSNAAPMAPSSTMNEPRESESPFMLVDYRPASGIRVQTPGFEPARTAPSAPSAPAVISPSTNVEPAAPATNSAPAPAPGTNAAPFAVPGGETGAAPKPAPVQASVIVLLYHQFVPAGVKISPKLQWTMNQDVFESEMKYIHDNGYHVVPMSDLLKFLKHEIGLPPNSVVITIDDGYKSAIVYAAPILKKYGYPWTYFVYPDFITVNEGKGAASWNDLLALQADGVDIESHSMTHPTLTKHQQKIKGVWHNLSPEEYDQWLTNETAGSKAILEQKMGKPIVSFAYPYGAYNKEVEAKAIAAGYDAIFTVADNPVHSNTDMHSIGRYTITQSVEKNFAAYLRQGALGVAEADPAPGSTTTNPRPVISAVLGYAGDLDPNAIETSVRDFGDVRHDFDPKTSTIRLYLPRDLIQSPVMVNLRVKDAETGKIMVANWQFNYEPGGQPVHAPLTSTNAPAAATNVAPAAPKPASAPVTNAVPATPPPAPTAPLGSKSH